MTTVTESGPDLPAPTEPDHVHVFDPAVTLRAVDGQWQLVVDWDGSYSYAYDAETGLTVESADVADAEVVANRLLDAGVLPNLPVASPVGQLLNQAAADKARYDGAIAYVRGDGRLAPRAVLLAGGADAARAWYAGWDDANLAAPLPDDHEQAVAECGACGGRWDDNVVHAPSARCPYEADHEDVGA